MLSKHKVSKHLSAEIMAREELSSAKSHMASSYAPCKGEESTVRYLAKVCDEAYIELIYRPEAARLAVKAAIASV